MSSATGDDRRRQRRARARRDYALSFSGYHRQGGGFWLSAAYWANLGIFLLKSDRGSQGVNQCPVDLLIKAFINGVSVPPLAGMCDPNNYASRQVFLNAAVVSAPTSAGALFASLSQTLAAGYGAVTLAEYLPVARAASAGVSSAATPAPAAAHSRASRSVSSRAPAAVPRPLGSRCEVCGELVMERALLTSVYIGCRCG